MNIRVVLASPPQEMIHANNFQVTEIPTPNLSSPPGRKGSDSNVVCKLRYLGLNAGLLARLGTANQAGGQSMIAVGQCPTGDGLVEVIASNDPAWPVGTLALRDWAPWQQIFATNTSTLIRLPIDAHEATDETLVAYMTVLGHTGLTAFTALTAIAELAPTDRIVIPAAAGGVGSAAVQFARMMGAEVIGIASHARRCLRVEELGASRCIDRTCENVRESLATLDGYSVFLDLVGGPVLEAAIDTISEGGRIVICGAASGTSTKRPPAPNNYLSIIHKDVQLRGFSVVHHYPLRDALWQTAGRWLRQGTIEPVAVITDGLANAGCGFAKLFVSTDVGRHIVRCSEQ